MADITINDGASGEATSIVTRINGLGSRVQTAILAGNFLEARKLALMMLTAIAVIPDGEKQGEAGAKLSWDRNAIQGLIAQIAEIEGQTRTFSIGVTSLKYEHQSGCKKHGCHSDHHRDADDRRFDESNDCC